MTTDTREEIEQSLLTRLVNQGYDRETATRIAYATGTTFSEEEIRDAQQAYAPIAFSLLKVA